MRGSRRSPSRWSSSLVSLAATVGLALVTVPAHASSPMFDGFREAPAPPADPSAMVAKVGPAVVDIDTQMSYQSAVGAGTGIVLSPNGQVLTNNHVIEGATSITAVDIGNGQSYQANVIGYDRSHDVAVLQLNGASGLTVANWVTHLRLPSAIRSLRWETQRARVERRVRYRAASPP